MGINTMVDQAHTLRVHMRLKNALEKAQRRGSAVWIAPFSKPTLFDILPGTRVEEHSTWQEAAVHIDAAGAAKVHPDGVVCLYFEE